MVFQAFNLFPHKTALENLTLATQIVGRLSAADARMRCEALLAKVGLADKHAAHPAQLSGGQQPRVAIARALRSAELRVGKEGVSTCSFRWSPSYSKKNTHKIKLQT